MCLAAPARVVEILPGQAVVERSGSRMTVATFLLDDGLCIGDWVAVQAQRYAVQRLSEEDAQEMQRLYSLIDSHLRETAATSSSNGGDA
jgi:hydrogenase expression/formation protein HypC